MTSVNVRAALGAFVLVLYGASPAGASTFLQEPKARAAATGKAAATADAKPTHLAAYRNGEVPAGVALYLDSNARLIDSPELDQYLRTLSDDLLAPWGEPRPPIQIIVQSSPAYYAEANDGGTVIVDSGLLRQSDSEGEVAAVLAHEFSHVLLGHLRARSTRQILFGSMEVGGLVATAVEQRNQGVKNTQAPLTGDARTIAESTFTASTLTRDLLAPSWNREQEREADRLAVDLLRGAGFDHSALARVYSRLAQSEGARSERLQFLHEQAVTGFEKEKQRAAQGDWKQVGENAVASLKQQAVTAVIDSLAARNVDHDTPEERQAAIAQYVQTAYPGRRDKIARDSAFEATLESGPAHHALESAAVADEVFERLAKRDVRGAEALLAPMVDGEQVQPNVALARGYVLAARNKAPEAITQLQAAVASPLAPAESYAALAGLLQRSRRPDEAVAALELGGRRIGRWTAFLPDIVGVYRTTGNAPLAESSTMRCAAEDRNAVGPGSLVNAALGGKQSAGPTYQACVKRLGYDPIAKQAQQAGQKPVPDLNKALTDLFKKK